MDGVTELAKLFKERNNDPYEGYVIGEVVSSLPHVKIRIGDKIILDASHLVFAARLLNDGTLKQGDMVMMMPSQNGQSYIVIDKAVRLNVSRN
jgi:hypothetical protein